MLAKRSWQIASTLALLAATLAVSAPARAQDSSGIAAHAQRCVESTESAQITPADCPDLFALSGRGSGWLVAELRDNAQVSRTDLIDLHRLLTKPASSQARWQQPGETLDGILRDYDDLKDKGPDAAQKFFEWLAKKFDNSTFGKRIAEFGDSLRFPPGTLRYIGYAVIAILAIMALLALFVLIRTIFLSVNPRGVYGTKQNPKIFTGDERGNAPVLSLAEIKELPAAQQPAALLVAAVDFLRGSLLPDNPWAATNAEISRTVCAGDSTMARPLETLISNAERTLYGEKPVTTDQLDASFQAATGILGSQGPRALPEPGS